MKPKRPKRSRTRVLSASPAHNLCRAGEFLEAFAEDVIEWEHGFYTYEELEPAYTLVLGAGASRSAGVPMQSELETALESAREEFLHENPGAEYDDAILQEWAHLEQQLLLACLGRAKREPNLTQLLAADLASIGILGPTLTTNFDDLMLAAFWSLPYRTFYVEPHVIYDARSAPTELRKVRSSVPLIIKVHGHHTMYRFARFQHQVRRLIPSVMELYRRSPRPQCGFIVIGYSGRWNDGIMAILRRKECVKGKRVYWLFKGTPPEIDRRMREVISGCDVRFVEIDESDEILLQMWERVSDDSPYLDDKLLSDSDLFAPIPMSERSAFLHVGTSQPKWRHGIEYVEGMTNEEYWNLPRMKQLQTEFLPVLKEIETLDGRALIDELRRVVLNAAQRQPTRTRVHTPDEDEYFGLAELQLSDLKFKLPAGLEWTRRNRAVFRAALSGKIDYLRSIGILQIVEELTEQAKFVEF